MGKPIRLVSPTGYTDITYAISNIYKKQVPKKGNVFMVFTRKRFENDIQKAVLQHAIEIPRECTEEQHDKLFAKYVDVINKEKEK